MISKYTLAATFQPIASYMPDWRTSSTDDDKTRFWLNVHGIIDKVNINVSTIQTLIVLQIHSEVNFHLLLKRKMVAWICDSLPLIVI